MEVYIERRRRRRKERMGRRWRYIEEDGEEREDCDGWRAVIYNYIYTCTLNQEVYL